MFKKQLKRMKLADMAMTKIAVAAFVAFIIGIWPAARNWVLSVSPWYFLTVAVILVIIIEARIWK